jgi:uncharacterized membrane protein YcgQ (UPF0703/DUF1980 family)
VIVKYAKADSIMDNDWYHVIGRLTLSNDKMGDINQVAVSNLEKPPDSPYLFENMNLQQSSTK